MKKLLSGFILGVVLSLSVNAIAASPLVGKAIQGTFPLIIDGGRASKDVIVVEGTSYLPVRAAGEMFGYDVGFENNTVLLNQQTKEVDKMLELQKIDVQSKILQQNNEYSYVLKNNEYYFEAPLYSKFLKWDNETKTITISIPNKQSVQMSKNEPDKSLERHGRTYINLSSLSLTGTIQDGVLVIE